MKHLPFINSLAALGFTVGRAYDIMFTMIDIYQNPGLDGAKDCVTFTISNILFLIVFLLSSSVQYNDPDPLLWAGIYLSAALMCLLTLVHREPGWLPPTLLWISLGWAVYLLPSIVGQVSLGEIAASLSMQTRAVEEAREIGGLLLVALWAAIVWVFNRRFQVLSAIREANMGEQSLLE